MNPFVYELPEDRIAQRPVHPPESAKLLVYDSKSDSFVDSTFRSVGAFLRPGDALVFNNSRVLPARLIGRLGGGGEAELLLVRKISNSQWECMGRPLKKLREGTSVQLSPDVTGIIETRTGEKTVTVRFKKAKEPADDAAIFALGIMPIPPYIRSGRADAEDLSDYQSIFAKTDGSVAAPTASLHFSKTLIHNLAGLGIEMHEVTLHVGPASFLPLWEPGSTGDVRAPGEEYMIYDSSLLNRLAVVRERGGRVVAVGTTVVRALESMAAMMAEEGEAVPTRLFIEPGYRFTAVDALITNFHQPGTTHLLLVEAMLGRDLLSRYYEHALSNGYRFLSYGDGMFISRSAAA